MNEKHTETNLGRSDCCERHTHALLLGKPRSASVRAREYCDLYVLDKDSFTRIIADHQDFAAHIEAMVKKWQDRGM